MLSINTAEVEPRFSIYQALLFTDSIKINCPCYNIRMHCRPIMYNKIFLNKLLQKFIEHIFALLFDIFYVQIGQLFAAQSVFKHLEEFRNRRHFASIRAICRFSNILQRLTVSHIIDQFQRKRCQKKRKDWGYKLL